MSGSEPPNADSPETQPPTLNEEQLRPVPSGALALIGVAVGLLLIAWLLIYLLIYLPRGMVG